SDVLLDGTELSNEVNNNSDLLKQLEDIRVKCGRRLGLYDENEIVRPETHALPKIAFVSEPQDYTDETGQTVEESQTDIVGRYITMGKLHSTFALSGAIVLGAACKVPGTLPNKIVR